MTKREFLDIVFALAPTEANKIMDAFDEYVESNEPHWIPVTERLPKKNDEPSNCAWIPMSEQYKNKQSNCNKMPLPEPYKGVTE